MSSSSAPSFTRVSALLAAALLALACDDPLSPEFPATPDPVAPVLHHAGGLPGFHGTGSIGTGLAVAGAARQDFDIDVGWDLTGRLFFRDWSVVRTDGSVATVTIDANDQGTWLSAYRATSSGCANPATGAEFDGMGRLDTGELLRVTVVACDNGAAGTGTDVFRIALPQAQYAQAGTLSSGDLVTGRGTTPPPTTATKVAGLGAIGPGTPTLGSDRQEFDFDISAAAGGAMTYTDYSVLRGTGLPGRMVVGGDPATGVTSFHQLTATCIRISGMGRLDTADLWPFFIDVCDDGGPGTGTDRFAILLPDRGGRGIPYTRSGTLTAGDIVQTGGGSSPPPPSTGDLTVTTATSGSNVDPDGYVVTLDGGESRSIPVNGSVTFADLSSGSHTVVLSGVASNCTASGGSSRTVTVPAGGTASASFGLTCTAPPATHVAFTVQPNNVTAGERISPAVRVTARDDAGNTVTSFSGAITVSLGANPAGGTLSGTRTVTAVNGVATFSDLSIDRAGRGYTLIARATGLSSAESAPFDVERRPLVCILGVCM